jgi:hypothetical protein
MGEQIAESIVETRLYYVAEALKRATEFFVARDEMNAHVHCADVRLSPITLQVIKAMEYACDMVIEERQSDGTAAHD